MNLTNVTAIISVVSQAAQLVEEYGPTVLTTVENAISAVRSGTGPSDAVIAALLLQNQDSNAAIQQAVAARLANDASASVVASVQPSLTVSNPVASPSITTSADPVAPYTPSASGNAALDAARGLTPSAAVAAPVADDESNAAVADASAPSS